MISTARLDLIPYTAELANQVVDGEPRPAYWADDFPFDGDLGALAMFLGSGAPPGPWGVYMIVVRESGLAVGGAGFHGEPDPDGAVEIGYGLVPSARGHGYAMEAAKALVELARTLGATTVVAGTSVDNTASQRILLGLGMKPAGFTDELRYELRL